ncbi:hypothetical protein TcWFU_004450 [Taenia crassiceps]|uniref:Uncharacterized protein n=1 Tax=Taenia crassiceps TaxID=6207 RepID=A0ABR4QDT7_9CEST
MEPPLHLAGVLADACRTYTCQNWLFLIESSTGSVNGSKIIVNSSSKKWLCTEVAQRCSPNPGYCIHRVT